MHAPIRFSTEQADHFRVMLACHGTDPASGACRICGVPCCTQWCHAYDQLALAGELMAEPKIWLFYERAD